MTTIGVRYAVQVSADPTDQPHHLSVDFGSLSDRFTSMEGALDIAQLFRECVAFYHDRCRALGVAQDISAERALIHDGLLQILQKLSQIETARENAAQPKARLLDDGKPWRFSPPLLIEAVKREAASRAPSFDQELYQEVGTLIRSFSELFEEGLGEIAKVTLHPKVSVALHKAFAEEGAPYSVPVNHFAGVTDEALSDVINGYLTHHSPFQIEGAFAARTEGFEEQDRINLLRDCWLKKMTPPAHQALCELFQLSNEQQAEFLRSLLPSAENRDHATVRDVNELIPLVLRPLLALAGESQESLAEVANWSERLVRFPSAEPGQAVDLIAALWESELPRQRRVELVQTLINHLNEEYESPRLRRVCESADLWDVEALRPLRK